MSGAKTAPDIPEISPFQAIKSNTIKSNTIKSNAAFVVIAKIYLLTSMTNRIGA
jgi:hypothetical protein